MNVTRPAVRQLVTIRDVARDANVAVSTVSRALNGSGAAAPETRERVLTSAAKLGYRPSGMARALRQSRTMTVGVLVPDLANPVFQQFVRGAENSAGTHGYVVLVCDGQDSADVVRRQLARLYEHRIDGLLLTGAPPADFLAEFFEAGIPCEPDSQDGETRTPLRIALEEGPRLMAFRELVGLGHRHIALVTRADSALASLNRLGSARQKSLRQVMAEAGLGRDAVSLVPADAESLGERIRRLAASPRPPTAYVAATHIVAPRLLAALYDAGLRVPEDASFLSFGDSPWAIAHRPPITVVKHDYVAEAHAVMARLIARIEGRTPIEMPAIPSEFVRRGSLAPPPR